MGERNELQTRQVIFKETKDSKERFYVKPPQNAGKVYELFIYLKVIFLGRYQERPNYKNNSVDNNKYNF